jgi:predicted AlkP superfamily phosphohydrolase/phosphomutase
MTDRRRVLVIGLDSVSPELLFDRFRSVTPNLQRLASRGAHGVLTSCHPPITVPAWAVMFTGMEPGALGIYGFRNIRRGSYYDTVTPTPQSLPYPPIWETLSRLGKRVCVIGVPPGYPPPAVNGVWVSDLLTPEGSKEFAYPPSMVEEIERVTGGYVFDVEFRGTDRARTARELFEMTRKRWLLARHMWNREEWDLFILHEIGTDRLHHAFWKYFDPQHPRHVENPDLTPVAERYYAALDKEVGDLLDFVGEDVTVLVTSDHGSQAMYGCFCINDWLREKGYLRLRGPVPPAGTPLEKANVDWSRTTVWGAGGYYARLSFNLEGRESEGIVPPIDMPGLRDRLISDLDTVRLPDGNHLRVDAYRPEELYSEVRGAPPDLIAYFGDLRWRSAGTVGHPSLFLSENDTGPDDAVHSWRGILLAAGAGVTARGELPESSIRDVAPTILRLVGVPPPATMQGRPLPSLT